MTRLKTSVWLSVCGWYTELILNCGHYEFKVMSFGLCNASSSFQATMNVLFRPYLRHFIIVFFDDILIYSHSFNDHLTHLEQVFQLLFQGQFVLKISKCSFAHTQVEYLGHVVSYQGVQPVASQVQAIQHWPVPHTTRALRSFLIEAVIANNSLTYVEA